MNLDKAICFLLRKIMTYVQGKCYLDLKFIFQQAGAQLREEKREAVMKKWVSFCHTLGNNSITVLQWKNLHVK